MTDYLKSLKHHDNCGTGVIFSKNNVFDHEIGHRALMRNDGEAYAVLPVLLLLLLLFHLLSSHSQTSAVEYMCNGIGIAGAGFVL